MSTKANHLTTRYGAIRKAVRKTKNTDVSAV